MSITDGIFLSHSDLDQSFCQKLAEDLRGALGSDAVWMDDAVESHGGDEWWKEITRQLTQRGIFLVILSPESIESPWVQSELDKAYRQYTDPQEGKRIIPILLRPTTLPPAYRMFLQFHFVNFVEPRPYNEALAELLATIDPVRFSFPSYLVSPTFVIPSLNIFPPEVANAGAVTATHSSNAVDVTGGPSQRSAMPNHAASPQRKTITAWILVVSITVASLALVAILTFVLVGLDPGISQSTIGQPVPANVFNDITTVPASVYATVSTGNLTNPLQRIAGNQPILRDPTGKPRFVYIVAEFCPYCAAENWSIIVALSRFGTFSNLELMASSSTDIYPNTSTLTFAKSTYTSAYLTFESVETTDRNQNPLQSLNPSQNQLFTTYDAPPYVLNDSSGGIPFMDIANQYIEISSAYIPANLSGLTWQQIAGYLTNPQSPITQEIVGGANYLTAAICAATGNTPTTVCTSGSIPTIAQQIAQGT